MDGRQGWRWGGVGMLWAVMAAGSDGVVAAELGSGEPLLKPLGGAVRLSVPGGSGSEGAASGEWLPASTRPPDLSDETSARWREVMAPGGGGSSGGEGWDPFGDPESLVRLLGADHPAVSWARVLKARRLDLAGRHEAAEVLEREAASEVGGRMAFRPVEMAALAELYQSLGERHRQRREFVEAAALTGQALVLLASMWGEGHYFLSPLWEKLSADHAGMGRWEEALSWMAKAAASIEARKGAADPDVLRLVMALGRLAEGGGRLEEAGQFYARVGGVVGEEGEAWALGLQGLTEQARIWVVMDRPWEGEAVLRRALERAAAVRKANPALWARHEEVVDHLESRVGRERGHHVSLKQKRAEVLERLEALGCGSVGKLLDGVRSYQKKLGLRESKTLDGAALEAVLRHLPPPRPGPESAEAAERP
ncbi:MAG: tetratricopeptide repeat protein [Magnetococcales bacterium]|nr:tetratricopeptide repeat protein [Magnetococcales bacterium]